MRLSRVLVLFALCAGLGLARPAAAGSSAADFVDGLVASALQTMRDPALSESEREQRLGSLLRQSFDMPRVARIVLGRYWTKASDEDRQRFAQLFERWVVRTYSQRLAEHGGETIKVTGARREGDADTVVTSQIVQPSGPPIPLEWRLIARGSDYKIIDIDVEGVSLAVTERDEIASAIQRVGGTVASLNLLFAERLESATAEAAAQR